VWHSLVELVVYHSKRQPTPPGMLRSALRQAMERFPNQPTFISRFIELERHAQLDNRLRRFFDEACSKKSTSALLWLFSIQSEAGREGANHRIVSLFEKALETPELSGSVVLWRNYLAYHLRRGEFEQAKVRSSNQHERGWAGRQPNQYRTMQRVFYRGVRAAPHSKALWLDCCQIEFASAKEMTGAFHSNNRANQEICDLTSSWLWWL